MAKDQTQTQGQERKVEEEKEPSKLKVLAGGLWFPCLFFFGFLLCYALPFHSPSPHHVPVAVAGHTTAHQISAGLDKALPGGFSITETGTLAEAKQKVLDRDTAAAFSMAHGKATLWTAKADGSLMEQTITKTFTGVAQQAKEPITVHELVPTAKGDLTGSGMFYACMVWNIVPYITVMMSLRMTTLGRRAKLLMFAGVGAFITVVGYCAARAMDIIPNDPLAMVYAFLIGQAVAWVAYGLVPFVKQFIPGFAVGMFVMLSIPSSGGAIPHEMVPGFFRFLHPVMPLGNLIDALHGIFYFDGKGLLRPTLVLLGWLAAGVLLVSLGALKERRAAAAAGAASETEAAPAVDEVAPAMDEIVEDPSLEAPEPHAVAAASHTYTWPMLAGRVVDAGGSPFPGAPVSVMTPHGRQLASTHTDGEGRYAFTGLPEGPVHVLLTAAGHTPAVALSVVRSGHTVHQDFTLTAHQLAGAHV